MPEARIATTPRAAIASPKAVFRFESNEIDASPTAFSGSAPDTQRGLPGAARFELAQILAAASKSSILQDHAPCACQLDTKYATSTFSYPAARRLELPSCERALFIFSIFYWQKDDRRDYGRCADRVCDRPSPGQFADFSRARLDQFLRRTSSRARSIALDHSRFSARQRAAAHCFHDQPGPRKSAQIGRAH